MFCLLGLPGSGKGVQSVLFGEKFGIKHIAPGVLLRKISETNEKIADQLKKGESFNIIRMLVQKNLPKEQIVSNN